MTTGQLTSLRPISTPQRNSHRPIPTCQFLTPPCNSLPTCQLDTFRPHATCQPDASLLRSTRLAYSVLVRPAPTFHLAPFRPRTDLPPRSWSSHTRLVISLRPAPTPQPSSIHFTPTKESS